MDTDKHAIRALITAQFAALDWTQERAPNFGPLLDGFLDGARMFPSRRPLESQTPAAFCARLAALRESGNLGTFSERPLTIEVELFGNVAVALAGCEMLENGTTVTRDVSALLLVKDDDQWRIAAQAWDVERPDRPLPARLATSRDAHGTRQDE